MSGLRYLSVCSGIEAASVAWHGLGWTPVGFSEIEPFPSAVLAHHYPHVPNLGDMTNFKEWNLGTVDLLVGGTPCQSFSVAGLRKGLHDPRGGLMLTFLEIAQRYRPRWVVWENVPGVLSSNGGRDFGAFLGALGELGYGWAYRVLDAQWFGVAQRRRRCFVVGCLGDQASAAAVLFESESVQRNPSPSRETRQGVARGVTRCFAGSSESGVAATLETTSHDYSRADGFNMVAQPVAFTRCDNGQDAATDVTPTMRCGSNYSAHLAVAQPVAGSHWDHPSNPHPTLNQSHNTGGIAASDQELFSQRGSGLVAQPIGLDEEQNAIIDGFGTLKARTEGGGFEGCVAQPVAFHHNAQASQLPTAARDTSISDLLTVSQQAAVALAFKVRGGVEVDSAGKAAGKGYLGSEETAFTLAATQDQWLAAPPAMQVRRLTPVECERLQGFPDGYTNIPWRKKDEAPDGPRYKALGNSMAVPCMKWIGERIAKCDSAITKK